MDASAFRLAESFYNVEPKDLSILTPLDERAAVEQEAARQKDKSRFFAPKPSVFKASLDYTLTNSLYNYAAYKLQDLLGEAKTYTPKELKSFGINSTKPMTENYVNYALAARRANEALNQALEFSVEGGGWNLAKTIAGGIGGSFLDPFVLALGYGVNAGAFQVLKAAQIAGVFDKVKRGRGAIESLSTFGTANAATNIAHGKLLADAAGIKYDWVSASTDALFGFIFGSLGTKPKAPVKPSAKTEGIERAELIVRDSTELQARGQPDSPRPAPTPAVKNPQGQFGPPSPEQVIEIQGTRISPDTKRPKTKSEIKAEEAVAHKAKRGTLFNDLKGKTIDLFSDEGQALLNHFKLTAPRVYEKLMEPIRAADELLEELNKGRKQIAEFALESGDNALLVELNTIPVPIKGSAEDIMDAISFNIKQLRKFAPDFDFTKIEKLLNMTIDIQGPELGLPNNINFKAALGGWQGAKIMKAIFGIPYNATLFSDAAGAIRTTGTFLQHLETFSTMGPAVARLFTLAAKMEGADILFRALSQAAASNVDLVPVAQSILRMADRSQVDDVGAFLAEVKSYLKVIREEGGIPAQADAQYAQVLDQVKTLNDIYRQSERSFRLRLGQQSGSNPFQVLFKPFESIKDLAEELKQVVTFTKDPDLAKDIYGTLNNIERSLTSKELAGGQFGQAAPNPTPTSTPQSTPLSNRVGQTLRDRAEGRPAFIESVDSLHEADAALNRRTIKTKHSTIDYAVDEAGKKIHLEYLSTADQSQGQGKASQIVKEGIERVAATYGDEYIIEGLVAPKKGSRDYKAIIGLLKRYGATIKFIEAEQKEFFSVSIGTLKSKLKGNK